jgi:hypothetical protein
VIQPNATVLVVIHWEEAINDVPLQFIHTLLPVELQGETTRA